MGIGVARATAYCKTFVTTTVKNLARKVMHFTIFHLRETCHSHTAVLAKEMTM
jgi:hypothetical protein